MSETSDELIEAAKLGMEAEVFLSSPLGRFLVAKAEAEEADAINRLVNVSPENIPDNREFRNQIHVTRMFREWLKDAVQAGRAAHEILRQQDESGE